MEARNKESAPEVNPERALRKVREQQMLQFRPEGFHLYEYVEAGEEVMRHMKAGETEYFFRMPKRERVLQRSAVSLPELFDTVPLSELFDYGNYDRDAALDQHVAITYYPEEFVEWEKNLVSPEDMKEAAALELARREVEGDQDTIPCSSCKGETKADVNCSCTWGGAVFMDVTEKEEESPTSLREQGVPNPDCDRCEGSGEVPSQPCQNCGGCGKCVKYPTIILRNEVTNEERALKLDLAALIDKGELEVIWHKVDTADLRSGHHLTFKRWLRFKVSDYIARNMIEMGIDVENSVRRAKLDENRDFIYEIFLPHADRDLRLGEWMNDAGRVEMRDGARGAGAQELLDRAQRGSGPGGPGYFPERRDGDGVIIAHEWVIRPLRPFKDALEDMRTAVAALGYSLGYSRSFIETGATGPAFFLLGEAGNSLGELGSDYSMRMALEYAWLRFQEIKDDLPLAE